MISSIQVRTIFKESLPVMLLGVTAGCVLAINDWRMGVIAFVASLCALTIVMLRPVWMFYIFISVIFILEEYPSVSIESGRWLRTPFYAKSIGIPGLYAYDLFFLIVLLSLTIYLVSNRPRFVFPRAVMPSILFFFSALIISVTLSMLGYFWEPPVQNYDVSTIGMKFQGSAIYLIAFAQTKTFLYFFLTLFTCFTLLSSRSRLYCMVKVILVSISATLVIGLYRLYQHPLLQLHQEVPLFYDTASSMAFLLLILSVAAIHLLNIKIPPSLKALAWGTAILAGLSMIMSFRRTVWLSSFIVLSWLFFRYSPKETFLRKIFAIMALVSSLLLVMEFMEVSIIPKSVEQRLRETTLGESSTLYRLMIYKEAGQVTGDAPIFGHGIRPLWNYMLKHGRFRQTYENVHSLYLWILFRWGIIGLAGFIWILAHFYVQAINVLKNTKISLTERTIVLVTTYGMTGFLITSAFFPVYGMVRFMVMMGLLMAVVENVSMSNSIPASIKRS